MALGYHPESVIRTAEGKEVPVKVHQCLWSGTYPENSLAGIAECYRAAVARAEIDVQMLRDGDFLVMHIPRWCGRRQARAWRATTHAWRHARCGCGTRGGLPLSGRRS